MSAPLVISLPAIIKAHSDESGRRIVTVQASSEAVDSEGDCILQAALLGSAKSFVANGVIDVDHLSEIGHRIPNLPQPPSYYIIGRPLDVIDDGNGSTSVKCELFKARDGSANPATAKAEEIWNSLNTDPPAPWRASIYGFPCHDGIIDCAKARPGTDTRGATRYLVSKMDWRSLALTRRPVNDSLTGTARIVTEKALIKSYLDPIETGSPIGDILANVMPAPRTREELKGAHWGEHIAKGKCPHAGGSAGNSVASFREHFANCANCDPWQSDLLALALMQLLKRGSA